MTNCPNRESIYFKCLFFPSQLRAKLLVNKINRENPETYVQQTPKGGMGLSRDGMALDHLHDHHWSPQRIDMSQVETVIDMDLSSMKQYIVWSRVLELHLQEQNQRDMLFTT